MASQSKRSVGLSVTLRGLRQLEVDVFVKVMVRKSTTKGLTVPDRYETYQLVWYLVSKIAHDNQNVNNFISRLL